MSEYSKMGFTSLKELWSGLNEKYHDYSDENADLDWSERRALFEQMALIEGEIKGRYPDKAERLIRSWKKSE